MKTLLLIACMIASFVLVGCNEQSSDSRVVVQDKVKSDNLGGNAVTRPIVAAISAVVGHGVEVKDVTVRRNDADLLEVNVKGYNKAYSTKQFEYFMEWLDKDGAVIESITNKWMPVSAVARSNFSFKTVATTPEAVDFRMNTRKNRKVK